MTLATQAKMLWRSWGEYAATRYCSQCGERRYTRAATRRGRHLCLDCFDLSPEADRHQRLLYASSGDRDHAHRVEEILQ